MTDDRMSAFFLLCVLLTAPLRAEPDPQGVDPVMSKVEASPPGEPAPTPEHCAAGPIIFMHSVPPHADEMKAQVRRFLARATGAAVSDDGHEAVFAFPQPRYGLRSLAFLQDPTGGIIMARTACADHVLANDAEVQDYIRRLHAQLVDMRMIVSSIQLIELFQDIDKMTPGDTQQVGGR